MTRHAACSCGGCASQSIITAIAGLGVGSWLFIVAVAAIIVLRFAWAPLLTLLAMLGVSSVSGMLADLMLLVLRVT